MGVAREDGIETEGHSRPLGFSAFEAVSGSTLRRPAANIWTTKGDTLVELMARAAGKEPVMRCACHEPYILISQALSPLNQGQYFCGAHGAGGRPSR